MELVVGVIFAVLFFAALYVLVQRAHRKTPIGQAEQRLEEERERERDRSIERSLKWPPDFGQKK